MKPGSVHRDAEGRRSAAPPKSADQVPVRRRLGATIVINGDFSIEFYEDEHGDRPAYRWITHDLSVRQRRLLGVAMFHFLQRYGAGVCSSEFGKALGGGLYEFRVRHDLPELLKRAGIQHRLSNDEGAPQKVLLRVFFSVHGAKIVLLLGGYDKAKAPSSKRQQTEIETARARLADWKRRGGTGEEV